MITDILIKILQIFLIKSILVISHELGHFVFAKLFKIRVKEFQVFLSPWILPFKIKRGHTEYIFGWLPIGGHVLMLGRIIKETDTGIEPFEFDSKPAIPKLLIILGGALVNFLSALFIYIFVIFYWGDEYLPTENVKYGIMTDSIGNSIGLENGDKIITVNNKNIEKFSEIIPEILLSDKKTIQIERNGIKKELIVPDSTATNIIKNRYPFIQARIPFVVGGLTMKSVARKAGIKEGDKIVALNGCKVRFLDEFKDKLSNYINEEIIITVDRDGKELDITIVVPKEGLRRMAPLLKLNEFYEFRKINYSFFQAIPTGILKGYNEISDFFYSLKLLISPKTYSYIRIGTYFTMFNYLLSNWNRYDFLMITAFLSVIAAIFNVIPFRHTDGEQASFLLCEFFLGRSPTYRLKRQDLVINLVIISSFLLYVYYDVIITYL